MTTGATPANAQGIPPMSGARVLVVVDDSAVSDAVRQALEPQVLVDVVQDGQAALDDIARRPPDLVLTGQRLPRVDGLGLLRQLRSGSETCRIPVILLSTPDEDEWRIEGLTSGADDHVTVPFSARELQARVRFHLERPRSGATLSRDDSQSIPPRFRSIADSAPVMIWVTDSANRNLFVNRAYCEFFGKSAREVEGSGWQPLLHPDDAQGYVQATETAMRERRPFCEQVRVRHRDGSWRWVESYGAPRFSDTGELLGMVGTSPDVTARKQAEEALSNSQEDLRHAQAVAHVGSWRMDVQANVLDWSDETYRMFGIPHGTPMTYEKFLATIHPEDQRLVHDAWQEALRGRPYDIEHRIVVDGRVKWVREVAHLEFGRDGALRGGFGTVQDISDRKELERALAEANQRKDDFMAVLSHELRAPLAPMQNSLYVLGRTDPGGEQARRMLAILERQVSHLTHLVNDLLDVTRISRGKIQLQREQVDLVDLVRRTADDHRSTFASCGLHLEVLTPMPIWLIADPVRLAQVVNNLLTNAAKFTPTGGRVDVSLEKEGSQALLRVRDTGVGISADAMDRLFEPFVQAERTRDRSHGGLGLGLALVKGMTELHGGSVTASSNGPGEGAEFVVRLPLTAPAETTAGAVAKTRSRPRRVLVIDDDEDAAASLKEVLELDGHQVELAHDGPAGLTAARAMRPDVVLCDIGLPLMNGYQVAQAIRADPALDGIFLVALSGYALPEDLQRAQQAGFQRHLAKPPSFEKLQELLAEVPEREPPVEPEQPPGASPP